MADTQVIKCSVALLTGVFVHFGTFDVVQQKSAQSRSSYQEMLIKKNKENLMLPVTMWYNSSLVIHYSLTTVH